MNKTRSIDKRNFNRFIFVILFLCMLFFIAILKLFYVQIIRHDHYSSLMKRQSLKKRTIFANRGTIYDRNYKKMAENIGRKYVFGINNKNIEDFNEFVKRTYKFLNKKPSDIKKILDSKEGFVWLSRNLSLQNKKDLMKELTENEKKVSAFSIIPHRIYPSNKVAGQIIGYVDVEGNGKVGIERKFNDVLKGRNGWEEYSRDASQNKTFNFNMMKKEPVSGHDIVLTIDEKYQTILEEELESAVKKWQAVKGSAIVLEPYTGEILAMSSYPNFDPNFPGKFSTFERKNKVLTDIYEPGSTFKAVTAAMLLEEKKIGLYEKITCPKEGIEVSGEVINDSHRYTKDMVFTFKDIIAKSSNIGTVLAVQRLNDKKFYDYVSAFGFSSKTDIDLSSEVKGMFNKYKDGKDLSNDLYVANISFGQGIAITPLQMIMSYGALANGGTLMKPMIVKGVIDKNTGVVKENEPIVVRKVVSAKTALNVRKMLRAVVSSEGTAEDVEIEGLKVCGKTGTSQKAVKGGYSKDKYDASFAGMYPYDKPELVCLVVIDSPKKSYYGGKVAGPVFKKIIYRISEYRSANNNIIAKKEEIPATKRIVPDLIGKSMREAKVIAEKEGVNIKSSFKDGVILGQSHSKFSLLDVKDTITVYNKALKTRNNIKVPDLKGQSLRVAFMKLQELDIEVKVFGTGNVIRQTLKPGKLENSEVCSLYCEPLTAKINLDSE